MVTISGQGLRTYFNGLRFVVAVFTSKHNYRLISIASQYNEALARFEFVFGGEGQVDVLDCRLIPLVSRIVENRLPGS